MDIVCLCVCDSLHYRIFIHNVDNKLPVSNNNISDILFFLFFCFVLDILVSSQFIEVCLTRNSLDQSIYVVHINLDSNLTIPWWIHRIYPMTFSLVFLLHGHGSHVTWIWGLKWIIVTQGASNKTHKLMFSGWWTQQNMNLLQFVRVYMISSILTNFTFTFGIVDTSNAICHSIRPHKHGECMELKGNTPGSKHSVPWRHWRCIEHRKWNRNEIA